MSSKLLFETFTLSILFGTFELAALAKDKSATSISIDQFANVEGFPEMLRR